GRPSATGSCVHPVCVAAGGRSGCDHAGRREAPRGRAAEPGRRDRGLRPARVPAGLSSAARRRGPAPARGGGPMSARVIHGDCIAEMAKLPADSIDAIVTDPPYGLGFMGKEWDALPPGREWAEECLRVLKPGGHLLAFGGTRTWHRLAVAIEDAGFEIRDSIAWLYGSGFPKSLDVSKAIDKAAGATREVVGSAHRATGNATYDKRPSRPDGLYATPDYTITAPATPDAERWQGWGTALKPAFEPVVVARKPLRGTVAANVLEHGTGALNIDGCRIGTTENLGRPQGTRPQPKEWGNKSPGETFVSEGNPEGRWPANVVLDESQAAALD